MNQSEILKIVELHEKWLKHEEGGEQANFSYKDLRGAIFYGKDLREAKFVHADLRGANFEYANLGDALFTWANLSAASFYGATMIDASFNEANMCGVNIDFSAIPMWCGLLDVRVDKRIAAQWLYHFCRFQSDDPEIIAAQNAVMNLANQFHRIGECGVINRRGE